MKGHELEHGTEMENAGEDYGKGLGPQHHRFLKNMKKKIVMH